MQIADVRATNGLARLHFLAMLLEDCHVARRNEPWQQQLGRHGTDTLNRHVEALAPRQINVVLVHVELGRAEQLIARQLRHAVKAVREGRSVVRGPNVPHRLLVDPATKHPRPLARPPHELRPRVDPEQVVRRRQGRQQLQFHREVDRALAEKDVF